MRRVVLAIALIAVTASSAVAARPNIRQGFWAGVGMGPGSTGADCSSCDDSRTTGFSGYVRLGGTISPHFLLGGETNGWVHSEQGVDESMGFASLVGLWYPSKTGAVYLKLGLGGMRYKATDGTDELTATAPSASLGIGYEARVGRNVSITPFLNALATSAVDLKFDGTPVPTGEDISLNLVQLGAGLTLH